MTLFNRSDKNRDGSNSRCNQSFRAVTRALIGACCTLSAIWSAAASQAEEPRPNVIVFLIDDLGWADLGCYGSQFHRTPNLDRLARGGMRFTQAYAAAPIGLPTRAALLTGRYPQRFQITASYAPDAQQAHRRLKPPEVARHLPLSEITLAERLKPAGYATACIGKWHLGGAGFGPQEQGFDVAIASQASSIRYSEFAPYADEQGNLIPGLEQAPQGESLVDRLCLEAERFIKTHKDDPFLVVMPQFAVHTPATPQPELLAKYGPIPKEPRGGQIDPVFAALLEGLDQAVGHLLDTLDQLQLTDRTMIVLTSDNGGVCNGNGQIIAPTSNAPLRDGMGHLYEGGIRVPLLIRWPGTVKADSVSNEIVSCLDLLPTICAACRVPVDSAVAVDGVNLLPVLKGESKLSRDALYWHFPHYNLNAGAIPGGAVREGDWKLIEFYGTGRRELFNVGQENSESNNLIEQQPELSDRLAQKLDAWRTAVGAVMPTPNPDYRPNPQRDDGSIQIHADTSDVFGVMLRYEPLPHKDTIGYWVRGEDWARFEFTVARPGKFRLRPHVGCGTQGGSLVQFEVAGQKFPLTVPATGHFQNFVPQELGIVTIDRAGRYTLEIKPQKKEGVAIMDVRHIELLPAE